ncbi:hypothetical protein AX15_001060 [Amanita polypyramis BW_CC]|nr:hypothetical protein AX15_001060 [Amanita polypyramis BW_CC]
MTKVQFAEFAFVSSQKVRMIARSHVHGSLFSRHSNLPSTHPPPQNNMSVALQPNTSLGFHRPLTQLAKRSLTITNNNAQPIAFKVKTTAPKLYCVRPNSGRVDPGHSVEVSVMLQAMNEEPPPSAKCKDKFLIQSTLITPEKETLSLQDLWAVPEGADESTKVYQQKLRVIYLPPEGEPLPDEIDRVTVPSSATVRPRANGVHQPTISTGTVEEITRQPSRPEQQRAATPHIEYTVAREESHDHEEPTREVTIEIPPPHPPIQPIPAPVPTFEMPAEYASEQDHRPQTPEPEQTTPIPVPPPAPSRRPSGQPPVYATLRDEDVEAHPAFRNLLSQYNAALAELDRFRSEYDASIVAPEPELRRREKSRSEAGSAASDTDIVDDNVYRQDGVPLQVVVIIALAVFTTTYLFL